MEKIPFEKKKFCQIRTVCQRWECSPEYIDELVSKGQIRLWHPEGVQNKKGRRLDVESVLTVEENGYLSL